MELNYIDVKTFFNWIDKFNQSE